MNLKLLLIGMNISAISQWYNLDYKCILIDICKISYVMIICPLILTKLFQYLYSQPMIGTREFNNKNNQNKIKFSDVIGLDTAKQEVEEIIDFLRNPEKYKKIGAKISKGVLLIGSPGNGKTLLAKALASEANVAFFYAAAADFANVMVGSGSNNVKEIFAQAKKAGKAIIFIDEIDEIGMSRNTLQGQDLMGTLTQLFTQMDGFDSDTNIIVIAATNRSDILDPALLRRFTRHVYVPNPDINSRKKLLQYYLNKTTYDKNINLNKIAELTHNLSAAYMEILINEAALLTVRRKDEQITEQNILDALKKIRNNEQMIKENHLNTKK